ncbi:peptide chain release factor N(5)-glutamine methyltransferase [Nocardia sp. NPDC050697]|uniref:peptide chain release factor N(5)-glutamine methyltransferase n=1 Tax=Nocardia sp. NPDC050697 TaxID=3155158 RepID=UPI0033C6640E
MSRVPVRPEIQAAAERLADAGVASPRFDAESLAAHVLGIERSRLALAPLLEPEQVGRYRELVGQRARRIPLQHLTGTAPMGRIDLAVGPGVFVPRPETELLFAWALAQLEAVHAPTIVDLCTGSGALALALANARPDAAVHAVELDPAALAWARRNADARAAAGDTPITLYAGDVTAPDTLAELNGRVDLLVANPPYVPDDAALDPEVAEHDPPLALFGGPDGLRVIDTMLPTITRLLRPGAAAGVEHDDSHGAQVAALFTAAGYTAATEHRDLADRPRFVTATRG